MTRTLRGVLTHWPLTSGWVTTFLAAILIGGGNP